MIKESEYQDNILVVCCILLLSLDGIESLLNGRLYRVPNIFPSLLLLFKYKASTRLHNNELNQQMLQKNTVAVFVILNGMKKRQTPLTPSDSNSVFHQLVYGCFFLDILATSRNNPLRQFEGTESPGLVKGNIIGLRRQLLSIIP